MEWLGWESHLLALEVVLKDQDTTPKATPNADACQDSLYEQQCPELPTPLMDRIEIIINIYTPLVHGRELPLSSNGLTTMLMEKQRKISTTFHSRLPWSRQLKVRALPTSFRLNVGSSVEMTCKLS